MVRIGDSNRFLKRSRTTDIADFRSPSLLIITATSKASSKASTSNCVARLTSDPFSSVRITKWNLFPLGQLSTANIFCGLFRKCPKCILTCGNVDLLAVGLIGIALSVDFGGEEVRSANFIVPVQDLFAQSENVQPFVFWAFLQNAIVEVEAINVNMRSRWFHDTRSFPENGAATTRSDRRACHAPEATWGYSI